PPVVNFSSSSVAAEQTTFSSFGVVARPRYGYIDKSGGFVIEPEYELAVGFAEGVGLVRSGKSFHFLDRTGKVLFKREIEGVAVTPGGFSEGLCLVQGDYLGYVNKSGEFAIRPAFQAAGDFSEGLAPVFAYHSWGFVDKGGKIAIDPRFTACCKFSEGLAAA